MLVVFSCCKELCCSLQLSQELMALLSRGCAETGSGVELGPLCPHPPWGAGPWELLPRHRTCYHTVWASAHPHEVARRGLATSHVLPHQKASQGHLPPLAALQRLSETKLGTNSERTRRFPGSSIYL